MPITVLLGLGLGLGLELQIFNVLYRYEHQADHGKDGSLPLSKEGHPGKAKIMCVNKYILDKHVWGAAMLWEIDKVKE